jgi:hypothetical protein
MKHDRKKLRVGLFGFAISCAVLTASMITSVSAQNSNEAKSTTTKQSKEAGRDPFRKYEPPRSVTRKSTNLMLPTIQERIAQYKAQKVAAMNARMAPPKPTTALLLEEIQIVGISRTPRGYAAIVEATPIKLSYVVYPGERFYNGQLVAIEDNRLVFRRETIYSDGRRERSVELKTLRPPTGVNQLSGPKSASAPELERKAEKP